MARPHNPVMPIDLLVAAGGVAVLVGLGLDWSGGSSGYGSPSVLKVLLILVGIVALLEPLILFMTRKSDLPVVWQTGLCLVGSVLSLVLIGKAVLPPDGGFGPGFFVVLVGMFVATAAAWTTVSREK
jgi:branched-subunit amino acid transport protein